MRQIKRALFLMAIPLLVPSLLAQDDRRPQHEFDADLVGPGEVPLTLTAARGHVHLSVSADDSTVHYLLTYQGLETHILFSHIHIGKPTDSGGVTVYFCDNGMPPHVPVTCPDGSGMAEGDFTSANVIGLPAQTLNAGDLAAVLKAIRAGETYANLHTMNSPGGEIRGQIGHGHGGN